MKIIFPLFLTIALLITSNCEAQNSLTVKDLPSLQLAINKALPGTTIFLANGTYNIESPILINQQGKPGQPITISAATTGGVEIKGNSGFIIGESATYITLQGFKFTNEAGKTKIDAGAKFCQITRNVFESTGKGAYLTVSGDDCQIDHNTFQNKSTEGQMISVQGPGSSGMAQRTWIHHNYFHNFTPVSNNCSSIQIGLSGRSLSSAHSLVEYNLFSETRGENENICNKSCDNIYRYNTFGEGCSELSLRHGNGCQVYGNFFIGSEGVRFYGHNHKIFSNYFEKCNPAINIGNGDGIVPRDKLTSHDRPDTIFVGFNTLVNNVRNIIMQGRKDGLGATCITVANNIIQGGSVAFKIDGNIVNPVWAGNIVWKTDGIGNIPPNTYQEIDPKLTQQSSETAHLQKDSPAIGKSSGNYPFVNIDIDGQKRSSKPDTGADQYNLDGAKNHVLKPYEVGPKADLSTSLSTWQSKYVKESDGKLLFTKDSRGDMLPDFSQVGYHFGSELPDVAVVKTISAPLAGNVDVMLQKAIDEVSQMPLNQQGIRGALLLKKGIYNIQGTLNISESGVVLLGEGDNELGTVLIATGKGQRSLIKIGSRNAAIEVKGSNKKITDSYVSLGSFSFQVENTNGLKAGDLITIVRPSTENWIHDLKMDQIIERQGTQQWKAGGFDLKFERLITRIEGNKIWIDQPIVMAMDQKYGGGYIYQVLDARIKEIGIGNILFKSEYTSETDEDHGWYALQFGNCENGWVKNVTSKYFGNGCVSMAGGSKYITVTDSKCFDAKSVITGGRRYSFSIGGQMCLVKNCVTTEGRHDFVTGSRVCGPNVFFNCQATGTHADIGPHHRWCVGTLYDNITTDGEINIQDRGNWGSGHGWAGANQVLWNCKAKVVAVQSPWVSAKNWCIGLMGEQVPGRFNDRPNGEWEGLNKPGLTPRSLYLAQVKARMKDTK